MVNPSSDGGLVTKSCLILEVPWTVAQQAPLSLGFARHEYWSGLQFPSTGELLDPGTKPMISYRQFPALQAESLPTEPPGKPGQPFSVQFSRSVVSDSLRPHESQHARLPCTSPTPGAYSNSCPSSWWCHPAISSSVVPFSSCPRSLPASGSFPTSQLFAWGGQSIGVSASASVLPMNSQDRSPLGWTGWISLQSKGLSKVFSKTTVQKHKFFGAQLSSQPNSHIHTWPLEKP